ncbi:MAG TPA: hypothetical protein VJ997_07880 [Longimicrobiales bacterium]|nr:hypothetical protein [Longimicrobiales bacterium]
MLRPPVRPNVLTLFLLSAAAVLAPAGAAAQDDAAAARTNGALRVYLDCQGGWRGGVCDGNLYRQEITFVNWVRQPQDAQVHVILTSQSAGGGGTRYTLDFLGREGLGDLVDQFTYSASVTDVQDETLQGILRTFRLGLVRFAVAAGFGDDLDVTMLGSVPPGGTAPGGEQLAPEDDPWNFWVFSVNGNASVEKEDLQENTDVGFGMNANRTTEAWRFNVRADGSFERETYDLPQDDGTVSTVHNDQDQWNVSAIGVKTLGAHLGMGAEITANNSTQLNRHLLVGFGSGVEYNYFPYTESNRRFLLARYVVSVNKVEYIDTTVFNALEETVYQHEVNLSYEAREPWGNANVSAGLSQYLDRTQAWSFNVRGNVRYRLFRGFSVTVNGQYRKVRDQIYLAKEELSEEDILLGRRRLPTASQTEFRVGLSYSFGSIFNNAVNERFRSGIF